MYTVNKGPSKLVAKTRSGLSQNYDKLDTFRKDIGNGCSGGLNGVSFNGTKELDYGAAKPVFQQYRRSHSHRNNGYHTCDVRTGFNELHSMEPPTPQYEELIKYIRDSWDVLSSTSSSPNDDTTECDAKSTTATAMIKAPSSSTSTSSSSSSSNSAMTQQSTKLTKCTKKVVVYHNDPPSPALRDFGAFDLESWWGRRLFNNITKSLWKL